MNLVVARNITFLKVPYCGIATHWHILNTIFSTKLGIIIDTGESDHAT